INSKGRVTINAKTKSTILYFFYFVLLSSVLIILNVGITFVSYLYIVKEIIYLSAFYIVLKSYRVKCKLSESLIKFYVIISIAYGTVMLITGQTAYYGIGSIVSTSPSQSGVVYLVCFFIS